VDNGRRALSSYPLKHLMVKWLTSCTREIHSVGQKAGIGLCPATMILCRLECMLSNVGSSGKEESGHSTKPVES